MNSNEDLLPSTDQTVYESIAIIYKLSIRDDILPSTGQMIIIYILHAIHEVKSAFTGP